MVAHGAYFFIYNISILVLNLPIVAHGVSSSLTIKNKPLLNLMSYLFFIIQLCCRYSAMSKLNFSYGNSLILKGKFDLWLLAVFSWLNNNCNTWDSQWGHFVSAWV